MNSKDEIINEISRDLKINKYKEENSTTYKSRVIYSALSKLIKISTLDFDILLSEQENIGQSRKYLSNKAKVFLENILDLFPEVKEWFYPEYMNETPQSLIINRLENCGEIIKVGFNTNLALPDYEECIISKGSKVVRGMKNNKIQMHIGLTQLKLLDDNQNVNKDALFEFYGVETMTAEKIWKRYISGAQWRKRPDISCQVFNKYSRISFSKSWDDYNLKDKEISIYKENYSDYGVIKNINGEIYTNQFNRTLVEEYEVRRFMYGLKSTIGNNAIAEYKILGGGNVIELNLKSALPDHEHNILLALGWPKNSIDDKYNLIFSKHVWGFIEHVLYNLNISIREID